MVAGKLSREMDRLNRYLRSLLPLNCFAAPCNTINCANYATCEVQGNTAVCVCPSEDDCPWKVDLICGSDGQSYLNECVMRARACKAGKNVTRVRKGYCGE